MKNRVKLSSLSICVVFLTLLQMPLPVLAAWQDHATIRQAIKNHVMQQQVPLKNIEVSVTSLNQQVLQPRCQRPLQVETTPGTRLIGHTTLVVSCSQPSWRIHVAAHVDGSINVLRARYPISRGSLITPDALEYVSRKYSQLHYGYYESTRGLANMQAKRNIKTGQILTPGLLKAQKLVLRGQHITIVAENGRLNLRAKGKALMDGEKGQTIRVQNLKSKKLIYAEVVAAGLVRVHF